MEFAQFSSYLHRLEGTPSRLEMTEILAKLFRELHADEIQQASYLLLGGLKPQYVSLEFQLSTKMVIRALARLETASEEGASAAALVPSATTLFGDQDFSSTEEQITEAYKEIGDLGLIAEERLRSNDEKTVATPNILSVYAALTSIALDGGSGSQDRKVSAFVALLQSLDSLSARYVVRIILGKMRLGFSTMTLLDALSWSVNQDKSDTKLLELAYQKKADIGALAATYLYGNPVARHERLAQYTVQVGIPVVPALCQRLNSAHEIIEKMGEVIAEPKYDGLRVQIHYKKGPDGFLRTYTRNLEETTHMFPELAESAAMLRCDSCILDCEAIGFDPLTGALQTFQKTITRKRKHEVAEAAKAVPMRFFIFDVLELDGISLIDRPLRERKEVLNNLFDNTEVFLQTSYISTSDPEELRSFHVEALAEGLEGAVMKKATSVYQSGRKGWSWVKIKEQEGTTGKLSDTLDLVVLGYYAGRGKRASFGVGAFLVGIVTQSGGVKTIAKIGTGLTDEQFRELKSRADVLQTATQPTEYDVPKELKPDHWMRPELVVEIAADEITQSPLHSAGVALRFPRLVKFRDDKKWEDATSADELSSIKIG